jgi:hypothetical protein
MGKHYVPQRYLRGFEDPSKPTYIWMHDKRLEQCKLLPIKQVAQEGEFYSDAVEESLTEYVEKPGNAVIDKIRQGIEPSDADRAHLAYYIGVMIRRVPHSRKAANVMLPKALADTVANVKWFYEGEVQAGRLDSEALAARLAEVDAAERVYREKPPPETLEWIETPWSFESMLAAIYLMTWRIIRCQGPSFFLTSDNPAFFFECFGLGTEKAELIFPLCKDFLLHCSWRENKKRGIIVAKERLVKEFNRRIASGADRFIFYHEKRDWVFAVAKKLPDQLSVIQWDS